MFMRDLTRRYFLTLPLALACGAGLPAWADVDRARRGYALEVALLWNLFRFSDRGSISEHVDRAARTYEIAIVGEGAGSIETRIETQGTRASDRWLPVRTRSRFVVRGRESRIDVAYDYERSTITFRARSETFFLGRERLVNDSVRIPRGLRVDDALSALLNYREELWRPDARGVYRTHIVRRERKTGERPDDVSPDGYHAELVPFEFKVERGSAVFDLTRFSSWATDDAPARVVFGPDRRPVQLSASLMLGTRLTIQFAPSSMQSLGRAVPLPWRQA
jgi:hypothetical protein